MFFVVVQNLQLYQYGIYKLVKFPLLFPPLHHDF